MPVSKRIALALHGGAGVRRHSDAPAAVSHMRGLIEAGAKLLREGASALDVVVETIAAMEESGLFVAGRGASPNLRGGYELDASLVDGTNGAAGAVAALEGFRHPIRAARAVMEATPHVLLVGSGAASFAREQGLAEIGDPAAWFAPASGGAASPAHGTVGCVALDGVGRLAAGTSTGGTYGKRAGRVGDSPIVGAGSWADRMVAVSCTGQGEYFLRIAASAQLAMRMRFTGAGLDEAAEAVLDEVAALGGEGGLIALSSDGAIRMPFNSAAMCRAACHPDGRIEVAVD